MNRLIGMLFILCLVALPMKGNPAGDDFYNPMADSSAMVVCGKARFTVLTPRLIRIQYSRNAMFEDRATFAVVNRKLPVPQFTVTEEGQYLYIKTSALTLRYRKNASISTTSQNGAALRITFDMNGEQVLWYPGKDDALNLKGTTRTLDGAIGDSKRVEMENGLISRAGWAVIDESPKAKRGDGSTTFAFDKTVDGIPWLARPVDLTAVDLYFLGYGHDYKQALADFTKIGGKEPMPPRYVFGYWYSRYWAYTQQQFVNLVKTMQSDDIPLDVMILDMDWHTAGWTGWTWNKELIPRPKDLLSWMHSRSLKTSLNLHPADGVDSDEDGFKALRDDLGLPKTTTNIPWQLEDSNFYKNMFKDIIRPLENTGVDFWWIDWQQNLTSKFTDGLGETFWCNHVFYNDMKQHHADHRPLIFHRWGGIGSHRYPIGFSGDAIIDYTTLDYETYFTPTASNVCFGYWGHDLGGHALAGERDPNDPEMYLRWMQFGAFTPIFRTHATNSNRIERRIWEFDNFKDLRDVVQLRYIMMPYIYTAARQAYDTGVSICRPMYYDHPEDNDAYRFENQYMFGDDILVSPVTTATGSNGLAWRKTWLPKGEWFNVCRNTMESGDKVLNDGYKTTEIPVFLKGGSIIPCYADTLRNLEKLPTDITLKVVPGANGTGTLYEDDGDNDDYKDGAFTTTTYTQTRSGNSVTLTIGEVKGQFDGMPEAHDYTVQFLCEEKEPDNVTLNGETLTKDVDWTYDKASKTVTVTIKALGAADSAVIALQGVATGIANIRSEKTADAPMWNMAGQRVGYGYRGIVIQNGKKRVNL